MIPIWQLLGTRRAFGKRLRVALDGTVVEGVVVHVDRFDPSCEVDSLELRFDDGRRVHVPGHTPGELVDVDAERTA